MWYSGQQLVLSKKQLSLAPTQSAGSYAAGIVTLAGAYGLQSTLFPKLAEKPNKATRASSKSKSFVPPHKQAQAYQPPQTMGEVFQRMGRPLLMRVGAGSVAFFCAGIVQTIVASGSNS